jgi:hypothetical protein
MAFSGSLVPILVVLGIGRYAAVRSGGSRGSSTNHAKISGLTMDRLRE